MTRYLATASLFLGVAFLSATPTHAGDGFGEYGTATATKDGTKLTVELKGSGDWKLNLDFSFFAEAGGVKKGKGDCTVNGDHGGKADGATCVLDGVSGTSGRAKAVFCKKDGTQCTSPLEQSFTF